MYTALNEPSLKEKNSFDQHHFIGNLLLEEIKAIKEGVFILPAIIDFIGAVRKSLIPSYTFASFEIFLSNYARLDLKEDLLIRGKIVGRYIPRVEYQPFFPIGTGKIFNGSHFTVAHFSPDMDTVIASFHGFLDAFAAKVGKGVHYWQVPGGPPSGSIEIENLFCKPLGSDIFDVLVKKSRELSLTSLDLISQEHKIMKTLFESSIGVNHDRTTNSVIVVNEKGEYIADWRATDYDEVRMVINHFQLTLKSFEKALTMGIITFLLHQGDLKQEVQRLLKKSILEFFHSGLDESRCREKLSLFIIEVLGYKKGLELTMKEFFSSTKELKKIYSELEKLDSNNGIEKTLEMFHQELLHYFSYLDSLEIAIAVKRKVLLLQPITVSHLDDYQTIVTKMEGHSHLTVIHQDKQGAIPLGVIHSKDLKGSCLATVSMRDFSNSDEMDKPPFMDIISCIDHHKSDFKTNVPSTVLVSDAQSTNSTIAKMHMRINDRYSSSGYSLEEIEGQIREISSNIKEGSSIRILKRLLSKKEVISKGSRYFIAKEKEYLDYTHFLFAILDDTDLLTKVTAVDVYVVAALVNRMKSMMLRKEVEIVCFDDLDKDSPEFADKAAKKLLQSHDLYSLYSDNYAKKEKQVEETLKKATAEHEELFFQDTKIIGKYGEVGQYKMFSSNHATYHKKKKEIQKHWLQRCAEHAKDQPSLSIFIFMISTIDSAEDLFSGAKGGGSKLKDEIWVTCIEGNRESYEKAVRFTKNVLQSPKVYPQEVIVALYGEFCDGETVMKKISSRIEVKMAGFSKETLLELYVDLKSLKSRKTDVAPYIK